MKWELYPITGFDWICLYLENGARVDEVAHLELGMNCLTQIPKPNLKEMPVILKPDFITKNNIYNFRIEYFTDCMQILDMLYFFPDSFCIAPSILSAAITYTVIKKRNPQFEGLFLLIIDKLNSFIKQITGFDYSMIKEAVLFVKKRVKGEFMPKPVYSIKSLGTYFFQPNYEGLQEYLDNLG